MQGNAFSLLVQGGVSVALFSPTTSLWQTFSPQFQKNLERGFTNQLLQAYTDLTDLSPS